MSISWTKGTAWAVLALGAAHIAYGVVSFRLPFAAALAEGWIARFGVSDERRLAAWFTLFGPVVMLCGHLAVRAAAVDDTATLGLIGKYLLVVAIAGVMAFPKSPLGLLLFVALAMIACSKGWLN